MPTLQNRGGKGLLMPVSLLSMKRRTEISKKMIGNIAWTNNAHRKT